MQKVSKMIPGYFRNSRKEIWLNVASSSHVLEDFVNLDNHVFLHFLRVLTRFRRFVPRKYWEAIDSYDAARNKALLLKHDCRKPLFFPDNSVDHILCSHFLEHVFPAEAKMILIDFYRILRPNATLHVIVPDLELCAEEYLTGTSAGDPFAADKFVVGTLLSREERGSLIYRLLEFFGGFGLQHRWMYDYSSLSNKLTAAGFKVVDENDSPSRGYRMGDGSVHVFARKE